MCGAGQIFFRQIETRTGFGPYKTSMSTPGFLVASTKIRFFAAFHEILIWLLVCLVPLQAPGLVSAELRGPAHYHDSSPGLLADRGVLADHPLAHPHRHPDVERHHHGAADEPILVDDETDHQHEAMAIEEGANGSGSQFNLTALLLHDSGCGLPQFSHVRPACAQKPLLDRSVERIDRPPAQMLG